VRAVARGLAKPVTAVLANRSVWNRRYFAVTHPRYSQADAYRMHAFYIGEYAARTSGDDVTQIVESAERTRDGIETALRRFSPTRAELGAHRAILALAATYKALPPLVRRSDPILTFRHFAPDPAFHLVAVEGGDPVLIRETHNASEGPSFRILGRVKPGAYLQVVPGEAFPVTRVQLIRDPAEQARVAAHFSADPSAIW
jgi:hypothetical protein